MHDALKINASVHKSGLSGGPTIQNGENREFLSVSRLGASHLRTRGVITLAQFPFQPSTMSGCSRNHVVSSKRALLFPLWIVVMLTTTILFDFVRCAAFPPTASCWTQQVE